MVEEIKIAGLNEGNLLDVSGMVLLYLSKLRHNLPEKFLRSLFGLGKTTASDIFWTVCYRHYSIANKDSHLWVSFSLPFSIGQELITFFGRFKMTFQKIKSTKCIRKFIAKNYAKSN